MLILQVEYFFKILDHWSLCILNASKLITSICVLKLVTITVIRTTWWHHLSQLAWTRLLIGWMDGCFSLAIHNPVYTILATTDMHRTSPNLRVYIIFTVESFSVLAVMSTVLSFIQVIGTVCMDVWLLDIQYVFIEIRDRHTPTPG